jgi:hypothetical protein
LISPPFFPLLFTRGERERVYDNYKFPKPLPSLSTRDALSSGNNDDSASDKQKERERGRKALSLAFVRTSSRFLSRCCSVKSYQNFLISHAARHAQNCFFKKKERPLSSLGALLVAKLKRWRDVYLASYFFFFFFKGNERRECGRRARVIGE